METLLEKDTLCFRFLSGNSFQYILRLPSQQQSTSLPLISIVYAQQNQPERIILVEGTFIYANCINTSDHFHICLHFLDQQRNNQVTYITSPKTINFEFRITPENQGNPIANLPELKVRTQTITLP